MWSVCWVSHVSATRNEKDLWYIRLRVTYETKVANTSTFAKCKRKHQNETQDTNSHPIQGTSTIDTNDTVSYRQNNNRTRTGKISNKNDMLWSYTLLNDKDNIIRRNRRHLIKMDPNFVKTENGNDIDNEIET